MKEKAEEGSASFIAKQTHNDWFNVSSPNSKEEKMKRQEFSRLEMVCQHCGGYSQLNVTNARVGWILDDPQVVAICDSCGAKHTLVLETPFGDAASDIQAHEVMLESADFYQDVFPFMEEGQGGSNHSAESVSEGASINPAVVPANTDNPRAGAFFVTSLGDVASGGFQNRKQDDSDDILKF